MTYLHDAIYALNSNIVTIRGDVAYDKDENIVEYDKVAAQTKFEQMQADEEATKQSAISKLAALGLTDAEIKALTGN